MLLLVFNFVYMGVYRGSRGSSCSPNFWHGRAGHSSCSPKSLSLLHCDVRLSRIDLDILEFCRSVGRSRTKKLSASGGLRPLAPHQGLCPWSPLAVLPPDPRYRLALHALAMAPDTACSPNFQILPTPMFVYVMPETLNAQQHVKNIVEIGV